MDHNGAEKPNLDETHVFPKYQEMAMMWNAPMVFMTVVCGFPTITYSSPSNWYSIAVPA